jgi:hypothetical protein
MQHITVERLDASQILRLKTILVTGAVILAITLIPSSFAQKSTQDMFPSADAASRALLVAVQSDNNQALAQVLGGGMELVSTDDRAEDQLEREQFAKKYEEMHRLVREPDGTTVFMSAPRTGRFRFLWLRKPGRGISMRRPERKRSCFAESEKTKQPQSKPVTHWC